MEGGVFFELIRDCDGNPLVLFDIEHGTIRATTDEPCFARNPGAKVILPLDSYRADAPQSNVLDVVNEDIA